MKRYSDFLRGRLRFEFYRLRGYLGSRGLFGEHNPPIFLVGTPNSGTTVLARGVSAHPEIRYGSNASVLWHKNVHSRTENALKEAEDVTRGDRARIRGNFSYYQWRNDQKYIMNRNARNSFRVHYIKEIFPESLIIHIVRDGRAVVRSNLRGHGGFEHSRDDVLHPFDRFVIPPGWGEWKDRSPIEQYAYMWNETSLYSSREGKVYGDDYFEYHYEDLPDHSDEILGEIWSALGLQTSDEILEGAPDFENRNYKWKNELDPDQVHTIEDVAREGLEYFNYLK